MDAHGNNRAERKKQLLRELAQIQVEELRDEGVFRKTPHYSTLESAASELGKLLSREAQLQAGREVRAECCDEAVCPTCKARCQVETKSREVVSIDGPVTIDEAVAECSECRRSFFPSAD